MSLQAIVFDFDGVIADTEPVHLRAFQEELAPMGLALSQQDYLDRYLGVTDREAFEAVGRDRGRELPAEVIERLVTQKTARMQSLLATMTPVFPGVASRVREWARRVPVAIASGALRAEIDAVLASAGLTSCFLTIVSANDPVEGKPSPQPYRVAMARLAEAGGFAATLDPARCVAIEDSRWGIAAARAAGMRVIAVTSSYPADALGDADMVVPSVGALGFGDLVAVLGRR